MKNNFKRSTAWMLCLALLLGLFAGVPGAVIAKVNAAENEATVEEKNLVLNSSFEDYAIPNWTIDEGVVASRDLADEYSAWSLKINLKDAAAVSEAVAAVAGYTYNAAAYVNGAGKLAVVFYDAAGKIIDEQAVEAASTQWEKVTLAANAPTGTVAAAVKLSATTADAVYFDDVELDMGDMWYTANLLNAGFEEWNAKGTSPLNWDINIDTKEDTYAHGAAEEVEGRGNVVAFDRQNQKLQIASKKFDVVGGMSYVITLDVFQTVAMDFQVYLQVWDADGVKTNPVKIEYDHYYDMYGANFPVNEWATIAYGCMVPATATKARILVTAPWEATGVMKLDNATAAVATDIADGSFENATIQSGVASGHALRNGKEASYINTDPEYVKTGAQSQKNPGNGWMYSTPVGVIAGETYTTSISIKTTPEDAAAWATNTQYYLYFYDANGNKVGSKMTTAAATTDWTDITLEMKAPEGAVSAITLFLAPAHTVYFDDQTFVKTTDILGDITIANADFETEIKGDSIVPNWITGNNNNKKYTAVDYEPGRGYIATFKNWYAIGTSIRSTVIDVTPGKVYTVSLDVKGEATTEWIQICIKFYDANGTDVTNTTPEKTRYIQLSGDKGQLNGQWTTANLSLTAPENAATARILLSMAGQYGKNADGIEGNEDDNKNTCYAPIDICIDNAVLSMVCEHDFSGEAVVAAPATCGKPGASVVTCPNCGATSTTEIPATGAHAWNEGVVTAPTCKDGGYTTYTCADCGETKVTDQTVPAEHAWDEGVYTDPTEAADGFTTYTCTACGETKTETDAGTQIINRVQIVRNGEVFQKFTSMISALQKLEDGDTIELLTDLNEGFNLPYNGANNVTFNGNDFTVNGVIRVQHTAESASGLTIQNVVFDATNVASYLVISVGVHENLTIQDCTFQNGAYISTYYGTDGSENDLKSSVKNLTITGCIFDGVSNATGTASAIILRKVENAVITGNDILSVEWNAIQAGYCTGTWEITDNNIVWDVEARVDGAYNLNSFNNAKVTISGNTYELGEANAENNVVNFQVAATDVCLICEDDVKVSTTLFPEVDGNTYCTGHKAVDGVCSVCGKTLEVAPVVDASLNIQKHTMQITSDLKLGFSVDVADVKDAADFYVVFYKADGITAQNVYTTVTKEAIIAGGVSNNRYYAYYPKVLAGEMNDAIEAVLYVVDADGTIRCSETDTYSVVDYLTLLMTTYEAYAAYKNYMTVSVELLGYGAAAQENFGYKTETPANAIVFEKGWDKFALAEDPTPVNNRNWGAANNSQRVIYKGSGLKLEESIYSNIRIDASKLTAEEFAALKMVIKAGDGTVVQTIESKDYSAHTTAGNYYVTITKILPKDMAKVYILEMYVGETLVSTAATYSVESYVRLLQDSGLSAGAVALAALRYGTAAALLG